MSGARSFPSPPPDVDLASDRGSQVLAAALATWVLAVIAIGLRLVSRKVKDNQLWMDDWLVICALVWCSVHTFTLSGYMVHKGVGKHIWALPPDATHSWAVGFFIIEVAYTLVLTTVKLSILAFYWRIFYVRRLVRTPILIIFSIVLGWGLAVFLTTILQCRPTHAFWDRFHPVHPMPASEFRCTIDDNKFWWGNAIPNICTDIALIALPIPYIADLRLPRPQKLALCGIFLFGAVIIIISIIRLPFIIVLNATSPDVTWNFTSGSIWSLAEGNLSVVCACLPSLKPILNLLLSGTTHSSGRPTDPVGADIITIGRRARNTHTPWSSDARYGRSIVDSVLEPHNADEQPFAQAHGCTLERAISAKADAVDVMEMSDMAAEPRCPTGEVASVRPLEKCYH